MTWSPPSVHHLVEMSSARSYIVFPGWLRPADLTRAERLAARVAKAKYGDVRGWVEIDAWAAEIRGALDRVTCRRS